MFRNERGIRIKVRCIRIVHHDHIGRPEWHNIGRNVVRTPGSRRKRQRSQQPQPARAGAGWLRLLGPLSLAATTRCTDHVAPYVVPFGPANVVVMDDSDAPDLYSDAALVPEHAADFASLKKLARAPEWLTMHRPLWGAVTGPFGITMAGHRTMIAALKDEHALDPVELMLSGHIHSFEALNYDKGPPQIIAGNGGDKLDAVPADLSRANLTGRSVKEGRSLPGLRF